MKKFLSLVLALVMTMFWSPSAPVLRTSVMTTASPIRKLLTSSPRLVLSTVTPAATSSPLDVLTRGAAAKIICNLILGPTTASALSASSAPFKDVPVSNTFAGYITYCAQEKIINGYSDGTFSVPPLP